ncbi:putative nuclease of restriction endonuclease-like (RecB) superfamily [Pedobacter sp. UYP30]|uniref:PDDEXK nuclease domain-containing protein n=1 Tax=Pedobacter sp. UYP30 TaxID=1756400 RepID=UPI0033951769
MTEEYKQWIVELKGKVRSAQIKAALSVNQALILLYWELGKMITEKENVWGSKLFEQISSDLKSEFPDAGGFSVTNLRYCRLFYNYFSIHQQVVDELKNAENQLYKVHQQVVDEFGEQPDAQFLPQVVTKIPWGHITLLISKVKEYKASFFYIQQTIEKGWTRDLLLNAIKMDSYGQAQNKISTSNFDQTLPAISAEYANEVFKSSYNLGFLGITEPVKEFELEKRLIAKIKNFVLELGKGFTFIGNQHRLEYNGKEYFVDILFFHRGLRSLVAIELKIGSFKAEYVGKMNLYLSLLDKFEKGGEENQSIGIILCADKDHLDVELALQDINKPIGVAEYQLLLPKDELQELLINEIKASEQDSNMNNN